MWWGGAGPTAQTGDKRPPPSDRAVMHHPHFLHTGRHQGPTGREPCSAAPLWPPRTSGPASGLHSVQYPCLSGSRALRERLLSLSLSLWVSHCLLLPHSLSVFARTQPPAPRMFLLLAVLQILAVGKIALEPRAMKSPGNAEKGGTRGPGDPGCSWGMC